MIIDSIGIDVNKETPECIDICSFLSIFSTTISQELFMDLQ